MLHRSVQFVGRLPVGPREEPHVRGPEEVAGSLAANLRRLRALRGWSLEAVAERAGVSKNTVIQVEQGRANPSISTLCRLADALGVGVASLIEAPASPRVTVRRAADTPALWASEAGSRALFCLGTDPPDVVELWDWSLAAGDGFDGEAHPPGTVELLLVLDGQVALRVGTGEHHLDAGDSVLFEAEVPHRYANAGEDPCRFVLSVLQPSAAAPASSPSHDAPSDDAPSDDAPSDGASTDEARA
jgi:transcriptional regulator with XRE-family HTH domain